ncbi:outer membrane protein OmpA-like peptidoglycan-associated protein [Aquimarina sp. MAR_2010_214]|uniref:OmpA family protein n=1 Tax=Aquimarina sp. MAR_2010_214 TaxID=1250026 RepID=UPI000C70E65B|nr:OmpA family protein [Aquimarina sp. MAR_2010_214]PKV48064.1 outer membrane protein OmpA-like peptidoglycan-associated protein [Aquimarina sp. MAR_2010_214]
MNLNKYFINVSLSILLSAVAFTQEKRLVKADENFGRYAFIDAREIYLKVAENGYESPDLYKKLGDCYYFNGQLEGAVVWYEKLVATYPNRIDPEYLFRYSQSLKSMERYKESDEVMEQFNNLTGNDQRAEFFRNTRDYLQFIEMQSDKFKLSKLSINSKYSDYAPSFNNQGELIFSSSRGKGSGMSKTIHEWDEMPFQDLFSSSINSDKGLLESPKKLKGKINTRFHESSTSFSRDGQTVYFTRNNYTKRKLGANTEGTVLLKLYRATLVNDKWTNIEELPFNDDEYSIAHPALSADGKKLYFASDMPDSRGLSDLYVVDINDDKTFGKPRNLGDKINTEGRETFPYISDSGQLYFASDGHIGLGGLDIFIAIPKEFGMFSVPYNVGKPVNSSEDDFTFIINENTKTGYFSSNRTGGKGSDDIYSFKQTDDLITSCNQYVTGVVTDATSKEILAGTEVILMDINNDELKRTTTDVRGRYKFDLECKVSYLVRAIKVGYRSTEVIFNTSAVFEKEHNLTLQLNEGGLEEKEAKPGDDLAKLLDLDIIYFDVNKSFIRPDAKVELQKIIEVLKKYPNLKIDVRSHTDSRSSFWYNKKLSEKRAKNTIKYIVEKGGIDKSRITGRGYGERRLINKCKDGVPCSDDEHKRNRRSEFIILK